MKGKVFVLVALLALALFVAGCGEKAGQATNMVKASPVTQDQITGITNNWNQLSASYGTLNDELVKVKARQDSLEAQNAALKADLAKFTQATNGKLDLLKVKAGIANNDASWAQYPLTGYSWNNPVSASR